MVLIPLGPPQVNEETLDLISSKKKNKFNNQQEFISKTMKDFLENHQKK